MACLHNGLPRNLGDRNVSTKVVSKVEQNEDQETGTAESECPHSTVDNGEPTQRNPDEGRQASVLRNQLEAR